MSGETIYSIACEMLETTNIYSKTVSEIKYTSNSFDGEERKKVYLLDLLKIETAKYNHRLRGRSESNLHNAYASIARALVEYISDYPVKFSIKAKVKKSFEIWLNKIASQYEITNSFIPEELDVKENDTGVALLKMLHAREGVSYDDINNELDIGPRAIQKDLVKLSPSLYNGNSSSDEPYVAFHLGGQPLHAEIKLVAETQVAKEKRFYTPNSVSPIILQENIMQLGTLLNALANQYYDKNQEDDVARLIAVDIWNQMSEYAQDKIKNHFAADNINLEDFIIELEYAFPDDHICPYLTEKEMLDKIEMSISQALIYLSKAPGRSGTIVLTSGERIVAEHLEIIVHDNGGKAYKATNIDGQCIVFNKGQVKKISF